MPRNIDILRSSTACLASEFKELSQGDYDLYDLPHSIEVNFMKQKDSEELIALGKNIEIERLSAGLSQGELAKRVGISTDTVRRIERGSHSAAVGTVVEIARALNTTVYQLMTEKQPTEMIDPDTQRIQLFISNLKANMRLKNINPTEMARRTEIEMGTLRTYLVGTRLPSPKNLKRLADALGMKSTDLWLSEDERLPLTKNSPSPTISKLEGKELDTKLKEIKDSIRAEIQIEFARLQGYMSGLAKKDK